MRTDADTMILQVQYFWGESGRGYGLTLTFTRVKGRWFHILFPLLPRTYQKAQGIQQLWHNRAPTLCQREGSSRIYSPIH